MAAKFYFLFKQVDCSCVLFYVVFLLSSTTECARPL